MSTTGELVRKMIHAHTTGDDRAFRAVAETYIAEERRKNHHILANELERTLLNGSYQLTRQVSQPHAHLLGLSNQDLPHDKERGAVLVEVREPQCEVDRLVLTDDVRESLERMIREQQRADVLRSYGLRPSNKVLFCGPPGCGKTMASEAIAKMLYLPLVLVRFDAVISSYLGETAANLRKVFSFASSRHMVMLFDEFDAIGKHRDSIQEHGEIQRVVNSFLQMIDGFRGDSLLIAATNHQGLLDSALWRRFDDIVFFDRPTEGDIVDVLRRVLYQVGIAPDVRLPDIAKRLAGASHADVERIGVESIKQMILTNASSVSADMLDQALQRYRQRYRLSGCVHTKSPCDNIEELCS